MINYIFLGGIIFITLNIQNVILFIFYALSYLEIFFKKLTIKPNKEPVYLGMSKKTKDIELYNFDKKDDYFFYKCLNYETSDKKTNYKFITIDLHDKNEKFNLELCTKNYTFYLNDNKILGEEFVKWFCFKYLNKTISDNYKIQIIDNNVNIISITKNEYIQLSNDDYNVRNILI